jgi:predicted PurR-regulated permease PerM
MASISLDLIVRAANNIYLLGFTLIISVFMLWERLLLPDKIHRYLAPDGRVLTTFKVLSVDISRFVLITAKANFISASGDTILLLIIGVDFAFLWGVLSFFLGFIPSIGFLLSLIPPMILAFLEFGWQAALAVLLGYWIINGIADNVIKPKFVGVGLNLSPMVVFLALVIWGWPLGLMGALLSIPLTMIVYRSILQPLDSTRWLANMMRYGVDDQSESDAISAAASETPS